jgi:hypothetical protein
MATAMMRQFTIVHRALSEAGSLGSVRDRCGLRNKFSSPSPVFGEPNGKTRAYYRLNQRDLRFEHGPCAISKQRRPNHPINLASIVPIVMRLGLNVDGDQI